MNNLRQLRKVKVLGYPFAGGQPQAGVELTPSWLQNQHWFQKLTSSTANQKFGVEYEEIKVSSQRCNQWHIDQKLQAGEELTPEELADAKNVKNVIASSTQLRNQTYKALKEGYYPIVLGGDHSQAIGSLAGMKKAYPDGKILWVDAHIDANTPDSSPSKNMHGMPLAYLQGLVPFYRHWSCLDMAKDLCYFGIRSYEDEEFELVKEKKVLVFESPDCKVDAINDIHKEIQLYFNNRSDFQKYWISFDIDGIDGGEFKSTGTPEGGGITLDFAYKLFERFTPRSVGMDFSEVNFELSEGQTRAHDEQTFRELLEFICHQVNQPVYSEDQMYLPDTDTKTYNF